MFSGLKRWLYRRKVEQLCKALQDGYLPDREELLMGYEWLNVWFSHNNLKPEHGQYGLVIEYTATGLLDYVYEYTRLLVANKDIDSSFMPTNKIATNLWLWFTDQGELLNQSQYIDLLTKGVKGWCVAANDAALCQRDGFAYYERKGTPLRHALTLLLRELLPLTLLKG